jgi:hypothetical protein
MTSLWRASEHWSQLVLAAALWLTAAVIVWGCVTTGLLAASRGRHVRGPTDAGERWLHHEARRGVREIEEYLARIDH